MNNLKIVFLDFTGTIDFVEKSEEVTYKPVVYEYDKSKRFDAKPKKDSFDNFYEHMYVGEESEMPTSYGSNFFRLPIHVGPNKTAVKLLKQLLDRTGAKIVYSSTRRWNGWKHCADYVGLPYRYSLAHPVFGVTPELEVKTTWFSGRDDSWFDAGAKEEDADYWDKYFDAPEPTGKKDKDVAKDSSIETDFTVTGAWKQREKEIKEWFKIYTGVPVKNYVILDDDPIGDKEMKKHWVPSIEKNGFLKAEYEHALKILS